MALATALYSAAQTDATLLEATHGEHAGALLKAMHTSPKSVTEVADVAASFTAIYGSIPAAGVPCGSGPSNTTHWDQWGVDYLAFGHADDLICAAAISGQEAACATFWSSVEWPRCPETTVVDTDAWGMCMSHMMACPTTKTYFDDTNAMFMDWWTIFYWAWWITWAPFVGFFVAIISRGRTVRNVIVGGFFCPTLFAIIWFSVFGGLAIKMERMAEVALQVRPEVQYASVTCSEHYSGQTPITPESKKLAAAGYYMLSCILPKDDQIYFLMQPYTNISGFLAVVLWVGLVIYFLTSSDSGSMTDDIISASGLVASKIPIWQKIFWCFTEGIVAISLVAASNGGALKTLQAASIIIGLPFTFLLCMMVPSCYRAMKRELGEADIINSMRFNTQILDIFEGFKPNGGSPCSPMTHLACILQGLFVPALAVHKALTCTSPGSKMTAALYALVAQVLWLCWLALHIVEVDKENTANIAWLCMVGVLLIIAFARGEMRRKYNIWGSPLDDLFTTMCVYPIVCAQMQMQAETDGKGMPTYFASADALQAEMAALGGGIGGALPTSVVAENSPTITKSTA